MVSQIHPRETIYAMPAKRLPPNHSGFALVSISWLLADGVEISPQLRARLSVAQAALPSALASLTPSEREELEGCIRQAAAAGKLPGPLRAHELQDFIRGIGKAP